jgi:serine/threonine protein kinase
MLRTPNLGLSVSDIDKNANHYRKLRSLRYDVICAQMYKCMNVIKSILSAGYIHGDVRETNVLCNLDSGKMTIIDFDWLMNFKRFYENYPVFFYCQPPECLLIWGRLTRDDKINMKSIINPDGTYKSEEEIAELYDKVKGPRDIYNSDEIAYAIVTNLFKNSNNSVHTYNEQVWLYRQKLYNIAKKFIDSYGLGLTFAELLQKAWYNSSIPSAQNTIRRMLRTIAGVKSDAEHKQFLEIREFIFNELIPSMTHSDYTQRWDIDTSLRRFRDKLDEVGIDVASILGENAYNMKTMTEELRRIETTAITDKKNDTKAEQAPALEPPQKLEDIEKAFDKIVEKVENSTKGGKRSGSKRRTLRKKRRT